MDGDCFAQIDTFPVILRAMTIQPSIISELDIQTSVISKLDSNDLLNTSFASLFVFIRPNR